MNSDSKHVRIGKSDLQIYPLGLGTNTFNNTAPVADYHTILDAFVERGGNFIDTADMYSYWIPGNTGGESEAAIGEWLVRRGNRDEVVIATKVSGKPDLKGLAPETIRQGVEESLKRLQTDYIDLYYAHYQDDETPVVESAQVFDELVRSGKVRAIGLSNFAAEAIDEWFQVSRENGFTLPVALQPLYSLVEREYEDGQQEAARRHEMSVFPYQVLASGFLTGKYRSLDDTEGRARGRAVKKYLDPDGLKLLSRMDDVARAHNASVASVALAWAMANKTITAPLAAATSIEQLDELFASVDVKLTPEEVELLTPQVVGA